MLREDAKNIPMGRWECPNFFFEFFSGGGVIFFSVQEEGYGMTIHAKNGKPGCISFRFMNFLFSEGGPPPPLVTPLKGGRDFFFRIGRGVWHDYSCKKWQTWLYQFSFYEFFIFRGGNTPLPQRPPWSLKLHMDQGVGHRKCLQSHQTKALRHRYMA